VGKYVIATFDKRDEFVHLRYGRATLSTTADVDAFKADVEQALSFLRGRKADFIVDLGAMEVKPAVVALYDDARRSLIASTALRAYRYAGTRLLRTKIMTSSAIHHADANIFASFEAALAALRADRARDRES
jgi:hypothetical protein